jgi:glycosyltransferase involved in cell wall biosynthesis
MTPAVRSGQESEPASNSSDAAELRRLLEVERAATAAELERGRRRRVRFERELDLLRIAAQRNEHQRREAEATLRRRLVQWAAALTERIDATRAWFTARRTAGRSGPSRTTTAPAPPTSGSASPTITPARPTLAIHIVPETWEIASTWGDTMFARDLQAAVERHGFTATIHVRSELTSRASRNADAALYLSGLDVPRTRRGQPSLLWIISHPDRVTARLVEPFDAVFVASAWFAGELEPRVKPPVHVLHQATDPARFFPDPSGPHHELLFVGNSRDQRRPVLDALAGTQRDLAIYGGKWREDLVDMRHVRGDWIPNEELRRYYSSADIVLADHWEDMRDEGFVANRVFDALACAAFVVSDAVVGIDEIFGDAVATYQEPDQLPDMVERLLADPEDRRERAQRGRNLVLESHTFDHRATAIVETITAVRGARDSGGRS